MEVTVFKSDVFYAKRVRALRCFLKDYLTAISDNIALTSIDSVLYHIVSDDDGAHNFTFSSAT